jgi:hypothetical protein
MEGLGIENVGIFYDHLEYFDKQTLWPFGIHSLSSFGTCFSRFGMFEPR